MRRRTTWTAIAVVTAALVGLGWCAWRAGALRREAVVSLGALGAALRGSAPSEQLLRLVVLPQAIRDRTLSEQAEFIRKALRDEVSVEGLAVLKRKAQFGPLKQLFPQQAETWATQAGVRVDDCVALRLARNGQLAEVVLVRDSGSEGLPTLRIVRVNNVRPLAETR